MLGRAIVLGSRHRAFRPRLMSASGPETIPASVCLIIAVIIDACSRTRTRTREANERHPGLLDRSDQGGEGRAKTLSFALHM